MEISISDTLGTRFNKEKFITAVNAKPEHFKETFEIALGNDLPQSWRAAWVLNHTLKKNDERLDPYIDRMVNSLFQKPDGHQRELLKLLEKSELNDDIEGQLFDKCITIWESVEKSPSVRVVAFRILAKVAQKYPEMKNELEFLTQDHYVEGLSPGIKRSFQKILAKI